MKKLLAILLALVMLVSMVACAASEENPQTPANQDEQPNQVGVSSAEKGAEEAAALPGGFKIGFYYLPDSDPLSAQYHYALDWIAEVTGCEMAYYDATTFSAEELTTAVESLISVGCDGVILVAGSAPSLFEYMNDKGVYYCGLTRSYSEEIAAVTDNSEYCVGWINEGGGGVSRLFGYGPTAALAEAGCKKIAYVTDVPGVQTTDEMVAGMEEAIADYDLELLTSYRGNDYAAGFADILASYGSELDGIISTTWGDIGIAAIEAGGYGGKIQYAQAAVPTDPEGYLESGRVTAFTAGNNVFILQMYMQLYNALSGADRLFDEGSKLIPMIPSFVVSGMDQWKMTEKYVLGEIPGLTPSECLALNSLYAPDTTVEEKEALVDTYCSSEYWNIEAIAERVDAYMSE